MATECRILEEQFRILWGSSHLNSPQPQSQYLPVIAFCPFWGPRAGNAFSDDTVLNVCKLFAAHTPNQKKHEQFYSLSSKVLITYGLTSNNSVTGEHSTTSQTLKSIQMRHCYLHFVFSNDSHWSLAFHHRKSSFIKIWHKPMGHSNLVFNLLKHVGSKTVYYIPMKF